MPEAASALIDLGAVLVWAVAFALATLAYYIAKPIADVLDVSIAGFRPFHGIAVALENGIVEPLSDARAAADAGIAKGLTGLRDAAELALGLTLLLGLGVLKALQYLWNHALVPLVHSITDPIASTARQALARFDGVEGMIQHDLGTALTAVEGFATSEIGKAAATLRTEIGVAKADAISYADDAVAKLRTAEDAAMAKAAAISEAAVTSADHAAQAALAAVKAIAIPVDHALPSLDDLAGITGAVALIASIPALATLVTSLAVDTGLENQSCRSKVKNICGTDANAWAGLLGGLAAVGFAFSLADLADAANALVSEVEPLLTAAA